MIVPRSRSIKADRIGDTLLIIGTETIPRASHINPAFNQIHRPSWFDIERIACIPFMMRTIDPKHSAGRQGNPIEQVPELESLPRSIDCDKTAQLP